MPFQWIRLAAVGSVWELVGIPHLLLLSPLPPRLVSDPFFASVCVCVCAHGRPSAAKPIESGAPQSVSVPRFSRPCAVPCPPRKSRTHFTFPIPKKSALIPLHSPSPREERVPNPLSSFSPTEKPDLRTIYVSSPHAQCAPTPHYSASPFPWKSAIARNPLPFALSRNSALPTCSSPRTNAPPTTLFMHSKRILKDSRGL